MKHPKQVTIKAPESPSPRPPTSRINSRSGSGHHTPNGDATPRRGMNPIPRHMLTPGQDGYRTPTIEDYEMHSGRATPSLNDPGLPNNNLHLQLPHLPSGYFNRHSLNLSSKSLAHSFFEKLQWRERIRHYTWTFFTMTMATGGIANVLYEGTSRFKIILSHSKADIALMKCPFASVVSKPSVSSSSS